MQPEDQQSSSFDQSPSQGNRPVVTLSSDDDQSVEMVYPVDGDTSLGSNPDPEQSSPQSAPTQPIHWQAAEYIHREKDHQWFIALALVTVVLIMVAVFFIKSPTFVVLIPVMAAALFVYSRRPPQMLDYTLSRHGLHINDRLFPYGQFKSFGLVQLAGHYTIVLIPTKRFQPAISVNFPEEAGEAIVDMLAARLPMREMHPDLVDRISQKLHL
jgi:hypothetical protein